MTQSRLCDIAYVVGRNEVTFFQYRLRARYSYKCQTTAWSGTQTNAGPFTRCPHNANGIVHHHVVDRYHGGTHLHGNNFIGRNNFFQTGHIKITDAAALADGGNHLQFVGMGRVVEQNLHQEAIKLGLG